VPPGLDQNSNPLNARRPRRLPPAACSLPPVASTPLYLFTTPIFANLFVTGFLFLCSSKNHI
jgi:hypothetical protein